jgi:hypothetical protein
MYIMRIVVFIFVLLKRRKCMTLELNSIEEIENNLDPEQEKGLLAII